MTYPPRCIEFHGATEGETHACLTGRSDGEGQERHAWGHCVRSFPTLTSHNGPAQCDGYARTFDTPKTKTKTHLSQKPVLLVVMHLRLLVQELRAEKPVRGRPQPPSQEDEQPARPPEALRADRKRVAVGVRPAQVIAARLVRAAPVVRVRDRAALDLVGPLAVDDDLVDPVVHGQLHLRERADAPYARARVAGALADAVVEVGRARGRGAGPELAHEAVPVDAEPGGDAGILLVTRAAAGGAGVGREGDGRGEAGGREVDVEGGPCLL